MMCLSFNRARAHASRGNVEGPRQVTSVDAFVTDVLKRGLDDWIQAGEVASVVLSADKQATTNDIRRVALEVIAELVRSGLMKAGDVTSEGFTEWSMTPDDAVQRIVREWNAIDRSPQLGEICWLSNTSEGDRRARAAHCIAAPRAFG